MPALGQIISSTCSRASTTLHDRWLLLQLQPRSLLLRTLSKAKPAVYLRLKQIAADLWALIVSLRFLKGIQPRRTRAICTHDVFHLPQQPPSGRESTKCVGVRRRPAKQIRRATVQVKTLPSAMSCGWRQHSQTLDPTAWRHPPSPHRTVVARCSHLLRRLQCQHSRTAMRHPSSTVRFSIQHVPKLIGRF